ncbi:Fic family protein [Curtobacterium pusillum]|uniref:Fic family protein n=1 Tax=Curtobacterium pusillum TaxID=69373 RepID=A0AAW3T9G9_9MICO|nr:Fic family protein [Curtobacterium pusillum]MBA8991976.1 Fic family protein [Curtobacterium pusillum]GLK33124.1 Fic family protein [Curtobacterium pusillum]
MPPSIAHRALRLSDDVAVLADEASTALARFDTSLASEVAPFAALLLRSEAAASSQIEHLTASARQIFTAELGGVGKRNASEIVSNTRAMRTAIELSDQLTTDTVLAMHEVLMEHDRRHEAGRFREEPVWIGTSGRSPVGAQYVAPSWERVPALVDDVMAFARRLDLPRLAQVAVTHAQFETIHPFTDGNGRTGRALLQAMLRSNELTQNVTVPVSAGLLTDTDGYVRALTAYRRGEIEPIIRRVAEASFEAVANARELVDEIASIRARWRDALTARRDSGVWRALDVVARQPVLNASALAAGMGVEPKNAYPHLDRLVEAGILARKNEYQQGVIFRNDEILRALDAFSARAGRRG